MVYTWYYDNSYANFFRNYPSCPSFDEMRAAMAGKTFMIVSDNKIVGMVMHFNQNEFARKVEIGILVDKECEGKTIGQSATKILIYYLLNTQNLYKVSAVVVAENERVNKAIEKLGFTKEGKFRNSVYYDGEFHDENFWSIFKGDFNKKYKAEFI
jgi:RimJ/RimL family protein N-acetyltransferase